MAWVGLVVLLVLCCRCAARCGVWAFVCLTRVSGCVVVFLVRCGLLVAIW